MTTLNAADCTLLAQVIPVFLLVLILERRFAPMIRLGRLTDWTSWLSAVVLVWLVLGEAIVLAGAVQAKGDVTGVSAWIAYAVVFVALGNLGVRVLLEGLIWDLSRRNTTGTSGADREVEPGQTSSNGEGDAL